MGIRGSDSASQGVVKTEGVCLRRSDYSETSAIITFFTRDWGKLRVIAKGIRRKKTRLEGAVDLLSTYEILFLPRFGIGAGLATLTECTLLKRFGGEAVGLDRFYSASFAAELVNLLTQELEGQPQVYQLFIEALGMIEAEPDPVKWVLAFSTRVLRELGFFPQMESCLACSSKFVSAEVITLSQVDGGFLCHSCRKSREPQTSLVLSPASRGVVRRFLGAALPAVRNLRLDKKCRTQIAAVIKSMAESLGGRPLQTARFVPF